MNGIMSPSLSFVGAMKIARNLPVSGRYDEWHSPFPAPSLRELSSECETEGVSSVGCSMPMVYSPAHINSEIFERLRSSKYTPSASLRSAAPSEREPGGAGTIRRAAHKPEGCGRFSSPLRNSKDFTFHHSSGDTPSVTPVGRDSSLREGAGDELYHSTGCLRKSGVGGRFSSPLRKSVIEI